MASLPSLIELIDLKIFDNLAMGVSSEAVRDVFIAIVTSGISSPAKREQLIALINLRIPDKVPGSTELIDPDELREVFVAVAAAISEETSTTIATRKTICFRINDSEGNPPPDIEELPPNVQLIPILTPTSISDLIALVPGLDRGSCDVYRTEQWQKPSLIGDNALREGEEIFITFFNYTDAAALYDLVQQVLAGQLAQP